VNPGFATLNFEPGRRKVWSTCGTMGARLLKSIHAHALRAAPRFSRTPSFTANTKSSPAKTLIHAGRDEESDQVNAARRRGDRATKSFRQGRASCAIANCSNASPDPLASLSMARASNIANQQPLNSLRHSTKMLSRIPFLGILSLTIKSLIIALGGHPRRPFWLNCKPSI
jgi:hypothetical protein